MNNSIRVRCSRDNLKHIRDFVTAYLKSCALSDENEMNRLVLAVDEICANLIIHANKEDTSKFISIAINKNGKDIKFEISDNGLAFDSARYKKPNIDQYIQEGKKGGIGLALVSHIMDKVEYNSFGGKNTCLLYKTIK